MAVLTATARKRLPSSQFALPGQGKGLGGKGPGAYPIKDIEHGRKALQLGAKNASPGQLQTIRAKVRARFPSIKQAGAGRTAPLSAALRARAA